MQGDSSGHAKSGAAITAKCSKIDSVHMGRARTQLNDDDDDDPPEASDICTKTRSSRTWLHSTARTSASAIERDSQLRRRRITARAKLLRESNFNTRLPLSLFFHYRVVASTSSSVQHPPQAAHDTLSYLAHQMATIVAAVVVISITPVVCLASFSLFGSGSLYDSNGWRRNDSAVVVVVALHRRVEPRHGAAVAQRQQKKLFLLSAKEFSPSLNLNRISARSAL